MTPDQAFAEAMKFENRSNPYPFYEEMRKSGPVVRVMNGIYIIIGYKEVVALTHDPRISADLRNRPKSRQAAPTKEAEDLEADTALKEIYGSDPGMIVQDPPNHDRMRRQAMRHFGPPHCPHLIPSMEAEC